MATDQGLVRKEVTGTVLGLEIFKGKPTLKLDIPAWGSQYPTVLYNVSDHTKEILQMGQTYRIILEGKKKLDQEGDKPFHYWWDFVGLCGDGTVTEEDKVADAVETKEAHQTTDLRQRSIERQACLKAAVEFFQARLSDPEGIPYPTPQTVIDYAQVFYDWVSE